MKRVVVLLIWVMFLSIPLSATGEEEYTGNVNLFLGGKTLDNDWKPVEDQGEFGIMVDFKRVGWPVSIAIDILGSYADDDIIVNLPPLISIKFEGATTEFCFGVRKIWDTSTNMRPFLGGGLAIISAEAEIGPFDDDDSAAGIWLGGGVYWTLTEHFNIGLLLRYSDAEVTLSPSYAGVTLGSTDIDAGGGHFGLILGYHW